MSKLRSIVAVVACSLAITFVAPAISVLVLPLPPTRATSCRARLSLFLPKNKPTVRCSAAPFCSAKMA